MNRTLWERLVLTNEEKEAEEAKLRLYEQAKRELRTQELNETMVALLSAQFGKLVVNSCPHEGWSRQMEFGYTREPALLRPTYRMSCVACGALVEAHVEVHEGRAEVKFTHSTPMKAPPANTSVTISGQAYTINGEFHPMTYVNVS